MSVSKADERWLACLDRAIASFGSLIIDEDKLISRTNALYAEMPSNRPR